jgi:tetratricopeptide (TPR) repeat protein
MKNNSLQPVWLKWAVVPLVIFLLAGWATKKLVHAKPEPEGKPFQQTVDASLKHLDSGDRTGAVEGLARAAQMAPGNLGQQASLIPKFIALGEYQQAADAIERSLRAAPRERQMAHSYASLCEFLLEHGDLSHAKRILTSDLLARWPDALETACVQGEVTLKEAAGKDDIAAAAKLFQKCLALEPDNVPAKVQLGIAYGRLGQLDQAEPSCAQRWTSGLLTPWPFISSAKSSDSRAKRLKPRSASTSTNVSASCKTGESSSRGSMR